MKARKRVLVTELAKPLDKCLNFIKLDFMPLIYFLLNLFCTEAVPKLQFLEQALLTV
jgi:hypothetical protein